MHRSFIQWGIITGLLISAGKMSAAELEPETLKAWQDYTRAAEARAQIRLADDHAFLWLDERQESFRRLRAGEILVAPTGRHGSQAVPNGLIHDWVGAAFIPNISLAELMGFVRDYEHYKQVYKPLVIDSKLIQRAGDADRFSMRWQQKAMFVSAALDSQYESRTVRLSDRCAYSISYTTNVQEIQNYGRPDERQMAPDQGDGFIWRLYSIARYEERDGGVYVEIEAMALTRDIPAALRFMVKPLVAKMSRNSILVSLTQTRNALHAGSEAAHRESKTPPVSGQNALFSR